MMMEVNSDLYPSEQLARLFTECEEQDGWSRKSAQEKYESIQIIDDCQATISLTVVRDVRNHHPTAADKGHVTIYHAVWISLIAHVSGEWETSSQSTEVLEQKMSQLLRCFEQKVKVQGEVYSDLSQRSSEITALRGERYRDKIRLCSQLCSLAQSIMNQAALCKGCSCVTAVRERMTELPPTLQQQAQGLDDEVSMCMNRLWTPPRSKQLTATLTPDQDAVQFQADTEMSVAAKFVDQGFPALTLCSQSMWPQVKLKAIALISSRENPRPTTITPTFSWTEEVSHLSEDDLRPSSLELTSVRQGRKKKKGKKRPSRSQLTTATREENTSATTDTSTVSAPALSLAIEEEEGMQQVQAGVQSSDEQDPIEEHEVPSGTRPRSPSPASSTATLVEQSSSVLPTVHDPPTSRDVDTQSHSRTFSGSAGLEESGRGIADPTHTGNQSLDWSARRFSPSTDEGTLWETELPELDPEWVALMKAWEERDRLAEQRQRQSVLTNKGWRHQL